MILTLTAIGSGLMPPAPGPQKYTMYVPPANTAPVGYQPYGGGYSAGRGAGSSNGYYSGGRGGFEIGRGGGSGGRGRFLDREDRGGGGGRGYGTCSIGRRFDFGRGGDRGGGERSREELNNVALLNPVEKNLYIESPYVQVMSDYEVASYHSRRDITMEGHDVPKPIRSFQEANIPSFCLM